MQNFQQNFKILQIYKWWKRPLHLQYTQIPIFIAALTTPKLINSSSLPPLHTHINPNNFSFQYLRCVKNNSPHTPYTHICNSITVPNTLNLFNITLSPTHTQIQTSIAAPNITNSSWFSLTPHQSSEEDPSKHPIFIETSSPPPPPPLVFQRV